MCSSLNVVDENLADGFAIIDKPPGLRTVPGRGPEAVDSVETRARAHWPHATGSIIVHRLDIETSGLLVIALHHDALRAISRQFMKRKIGKTYTALLDGVVDDDEGAVDLPLIVDWPRRPHQMVCPERGRRARTLYRVIERQGDRTRVEFRPITGRTHQLRVHASTPRSEGGLGCPILGDTLYGDATKADRLMLHADFLAFWSPITGRQWLKYRSPVTF